MKSSEQYALEREQKEWNNKKSDLERQILKLESQVKVLTKKVTDKQTDVETIDNQIIILESRLKSLESLNRRTEKELKEAELRKAKAHEASCLIEFATRRKQSEVGMKVEEYRKLAESKANDSLASVTDLIESLNNEKTSLEENIELLKKSKILITKELEELEDKLEEVESTNNAEIKKSNIRLKVLQDEVQRANSNLDTLQAQLLEQKDRYVKCEKKMQDFVEYEKKAWKILQAKDKGLQEREARVAQSEQFVQNTQSFLPPR